MKVQGGVTIEAPSELVWRVFSDVVHWPDWTESMTAVRILGAGGLVLGAEVEIRQPRLPKATWEVTELVPGESWTWVAGSVGVSSTASHRVTRLGTGTTRVEQVFEQGGFLGGPIGRLVRGMAQRYVDMEAEGLRRRCEDLAAGAP